jgi:hypothetical protein
MKVMNIYEYELYGRYTFEKGGTGQAPMSFAGFMQVLRHRLSHDKRKGEMSTKDLQMEIAIEMGRE